jgi:hypothetical protein
VPKWTSGSAIGNSAIYDNAGNIGVGIAAPQNRLSIGSAQDAGIDFLYDGFNNYKNQIKNYWNSGTDTRMDFNIGNTSGVAPVTVMSVGYGGNVGIGTTSPATILELGLANLSNPTNNQFLRVNAGKYNEASTSNLDLFNWGNNFGQPLGWRISSTTDSVGISVGRYLSFSTVVTDGSGNVSTSFERMRIASDGHLILKSTTSGGGTQGDFYVIENGGLVIDASEGATQRYIEFTTGGTSKMVITAAGNVAIGATSTSYKLDVIGTQKIGSTAISQGLLNIVSTTTGTSDIFFSDDTDNRGVVRYDHTSDFMSFWSAGSERMRINSAGRLIIGRTTDSGSPFNLQVDGRILQTGTEFLFEGDNDKRITVYAARPLIFATTDTERMRIQSNGDVYIRNTTAAPVNGQSLPGSFYFEGYGWNTSAGSENIQGRINLAGEYSSSSGSTEPALVFSLKGSGGGNVTPAGPSSLTERMRITNYGNVGIGTPNPSAPLHVKNSGDNGGVRYTVFLGQNSTGYQNSFVASVQDELTDLGAGIVGTNTGSNLSFSTHPNGGALTERMRITKTGNVGIGTTSVDAKLFVQSSVSSTEPTMFVQSGTGAGQYGMISTGDSFHGIVMRGKPAAISTYEVTAGDEMSFFEYGGIFNFYQKGLSFNLFARIANGGATYFNGGNVGINITAPTAKLHVEGPSADGTPVFRVNGTTAPDSFNYAGSLMNSDLGSSRNTILLIGKAQSNRDSGYIGFNHSGTNGSNSNFLTFGLFQNDNIMNITGAGNVGIGTTSPQDKLEIKQGYLRMYDPSSSVGAGYFLQWSSDNGGSNVTYAGIDAITTNAGVRTGDLRFFTSNAGGPTEKMRIKGDGNVGIGTTSPLQKLHVSAGHIVIENTYALYVNGSDYNWGFGRNIVTDSGFLSGNTLQAKVFNGTTQGFQVVNSSNTALFEVEGNTGRGRIIGGFAVGSITPSTTAGRIDASNDVVAYSTSDKRLKENITTIANALDKVKSLTGVEFDWKEETKDVHGYEGHDVGVIAQEVQAVLPEAIRTNDSGYLSVRYEKMIALLIEANKELAARVEELENKLK